MRPRPLVLALVATAATAAIVPSQATAAPVPTSSYIVTTQGPATRVLGLVRALGGDVGHVYTNALQGFSVRLPVPALPLLAALPGIASVEADSTVRVSATQKPTPSYGLDRIDQRALPLNSTFTTAAAGAGVKAYIIDTGILLGHDDFGGRAVSGLDSVDGGPADDCNGHGTHVAGTTGGTRFGVAKAVTLVAVRVLGCDGSGPTSGVIAGVDWVTGNHAAGQPAVANMSLGGGASAALDTAVQGAIADGVSFVVAAGNDGGFLGDLLGSSDACNSSPGRVPAALTVGATDATDTKAGYSNRGTCLDLFAPGSDITSAWSTGRSATNTISGTSMAAPHVAGAAALYLSTVPSATPAQVAQRLVSTSTPGVVKSPGTGSPNRLLFVS
ncbi:MAG: putative subtilase-family protease [Frankiales bacterium]|nr:putative subtilase-family protease [Frankiales bacterium]